EMKFRLSTRSSRKRCDWSMLYSTRAGQRDETPCKWRSFFMKATRLIAFLAIAVAAAALAAGCGSQRKSVSANDVAVAGNSTLTEDQFDPPMGQAENNYQA